MSFTSLKGKVAALAALIAVTIVGVFEGPQIAPHLFGTGGSIKANIWVAASGGNNGTATRSATLIANPTGGADFTTFAAAYQASHRGDIIGVACGVSYGAQTLASRSSPAEAAPATVVAPARPGCSTVTGDIDISAAHWVAVRDFIVNGSVITGVVGTTHNTSIRNTASAGATHLVYTTQPSAAFTGSAFDTQPVVKVEDANNAVVATGADSQINVTVSIQTGGGTLLGTLTKAAVAGVATFTDLRIDTTGARTLRASGTLSGPGAVTAASASFTVGVPVANIWVSTTGNDGTCTRSASQIVAPGGGADCLTFNKATSIASAGDGIRVNCGTYASQDFVNAPGVAPAVVIQPTTSGCAHVTTGASPSYLLANWAYLIFDTSYVTAKNFDVLGQILIGSGAYDCANSIATDHVGLLGNTAYGFSFKGATNLDAENNSFGPHAITAADAGDSQNYLYGCGQNVWAGHAASGIFKGNTIHDTMDSCASCHINGIYMAGDIDGLTVSNNKFYNLAQTSLTIVPDYSTGVGGDVKNMTIENNVFGALCAHDVALFAGDNADCFVNSTGNLEFQDMCAGGNVVKNVRIVNNTVDGHFGLRQGAGDCTGGQLAGVTGNLYANNVATQSPAIADYSCIYLTYAYDLWIDNGTLYYPCGIGSITSTNVDYHFTSAGYPNYDYTLQASSSACDFAPTGDYYPANDFSGRARLVSGHSFVAAGAYTGTACANRPILNGLGGTTLSYFPISGNSAPDTMIADFNSIGATIYTSGGVSSGEFSTLAGYSMKVLVTPDQQSASLALVPPYGTTYGGIFGIDEPDLGCTNTPTAMQGFYATQKAADPTRPVFVNLANFVGRSLTAPTCGGYSSYLPDEVIAYMAGADICSFDIYPVNDSYPITDVGQGVLNLYSICPRKPVWTYVETTSYNGTNPAPSTTQVKNETWQAIINGATGIQYFCWGNLAGTLREACITDGAIGGAKNAMGTALTAIDSRINALAAAINSPAIGDDARSSLGRPDLQFTERVSGGHTYIFATNTSGATITPTFTVSSVTASTVTVLDESRTVSLSSHAFSDSFTAYATHLYQVT